jgi:hypothetical protein
MMNSEQRALVLGYIAQGTSSRTACDEAHVLYCNLLQELDENDPFRTAYLSVSAVRDRVSRVLEEFTE